MYVLPPWSLAPPQAEVKYQYNISVNVHACAVPSSLSIFTARR